MPSIPKCFTLQRGDYDARIRKGNEVIVADALNDIYRTKIHPLEKHYNYEDFASTPLEPAYFESKPLVLLFGEYSTGKTSFIRYILGKEYPGMRIGPEPTTDNFIVVEYGEEEGIIPGNAAVVDKSKQFGTLARFGGQFLNRFQLATAKCEILEKVTLVDTPGILSGEKERGYDLTAVLRWFAERCDRIILLFDINKLDISDELRGAIDMVKGFEDKIRIVLNKSDTVNTQQLMRVYGALMWSLGKVMATPEAARVYIGSFWENPWRHEENRHLFEDEEADLIIDIYTLSRDGDLRKLNDLVRRAKNVRIHAYIMAELRKRMPTFGLGAVRKKKILIRDLALICDKLSKEHQIPLGDFPNLKDLRRYLNQYDFSRIKPKKQKYFDRLDEVLNQDIGRLMPLLPAQDKEESAAARELERQAILNKVWTERMLVRRPVRTRGVSTHTVSSEKLSDTSGVESITDHHRYQKISSRTTSMRTPIVVTKEDPSFGAISSSGVSSIKKQTAPNPHLETSTIVTRTESITSPSGTKTIKTETTLATPEKTEVKTSEATVVDGKTVEVKENIHIGPADPHLASYREHQEPKVEALYATIEKKKRQDDSQPPLVEEKRFPPDPATVAATTPVSDTAAATADGVTLSDPVDELKDDPLCLEGLQKVSETTTEKTEVTVEEKTTLISTTATIANGGEFQRNGTAETTSANSPDDAAHDNKLPMNIQETATENDESKILNVSSSSDPEVNRDEKRRQFLFGMTGKSEPSIIIKEMKESYDQSSIKDYDSIINDDH
ncbi:EH domain-containing protein 3 [Galendromus occidentalis]|uniref:EH domain-containing protein 3 n=1 Tax=Galendromus occidentalis TaxID=34638 RepID=A0AAJ7SEW5_9ACAR|nr:EH domain-containing protein 3 [Galendromus occidentalis]